MIYHVNHVTSVDTFVLGFKFFLILSMTVQSTKEVSIPILVAHCLKKRFVPERDIITFHLVHEIKVKITETETYSVNKKKINAYV